MKFLAAIVLAFTLTTSSACTHVNPTQALSCLEKFAPSVVTNAMGVIYAAIEKGLQAGDTEAQILSALEGLAIQFAPDIWQCAMQAVSTPDSGPAVSTSADRTQSAVIAADYLAKHSPTGQRK